MRGLWRGNGGKQRSAVSADFERALTQEVLRTELIRIKALIATTLLLAAILLTVYFLAPDAVNAIWRGGLRPSYLYVTLVPFILFELWVHAAVGRHLKLNRDVPVIRRHLGALIETTMPTIALALHIQNMGSVQALGFVAPLAYFIFIILSTLRLDFWHSTFTGFVAAAELFGMGMFYHPAGNSDPEPEIWYHAARSLIILVCGAGSAQQGIQFTTADLRRGP
jgi:adenylate cyclase